MSEVKGDAPSGESEDKKESPKVELFETAGRSFDLSTEQGKRDLKMFTDGLSFAAGKSAQIRGELEKEVAPLRKYNLKNASLDEVSILKKVDEHRARGEHTEADKLMFEYTRAVREDANVDLERSRLWTDYVVNNPDVFKVMDEDMAKNYIMSNYKSELSEEKDPMGLIDRILRPKASKFKTDEVVNPPQKSLGTGMSSDAPTSKPGDKDEPKEGAIFEKMYRDLGVN